MTLIMPKRLRKTLLFLASIYIGVLLVLMIFESSLIYPAPVRSEGDWEAKWLSHEDVNFKSADGTELHGWYCEHLQFNGRCRRQSLSMASRKIPASKSLSIDHSHRTV